ncbi:DMT family transporter [Actomonas aquatica]|uniref:DMT family transporter n=1 Tax=Actomonas aquatica TaxID=2866162 RepID=A0ABZ1C3U7_9BACT|nr:DMT family transporter [Opitutus sp. WL0086]WRQ86239.1 DMT family transporter [Opitutus sp. WL0086]
MPTTATEHRRAVVLLVAAAVLWSSGGLLIKHVDWPPLAVAGGRGFFAALFLLGVRARRLHFTFSRPQLLGAFFYAGCTVAFCAATKLTTAANAILLQYTAPVWIALFGAWALGERTSRFDWTIVVVVLGGMALFLADGLTVSGNLGGDALGLLSGMFFGAMIIALRRQKDGSPLESIILGNALAFLCGLPWMLSAPLPSPSGWTALILLGVGQLGVSYLLYAYAIKHVTALQAVLIPVIEPLLNPLWVLLAIGEKPTPLSLLGGAIVLGAVTFRAAASLRPSRPTHIVAAS